MNILTTIALLAFSLPNSEVHLTQEQQIAVLAEAQNAYDNGVTLQNADPVASKDSFRRSAERFQLLINDGVENGRLCYNLGNAYVQSGEIGQSIAAYLAASRYIPSDGRLAANLQYARSLVSNPIKENSSTTILEKLAFWHTALPTKVRFALGILCWLAAWGLISLRTIRTIPAFKSTAITLGCFATVLGISVRSDMIDQHLDHGVVVADEVILRKGNGTAFGPMFTQPIHEGIEFEIIEHRPHWLHILLPNGSKGWIQEEDAQLVSNDPLEHNG